MIISIQNAQAIRTNRDYPVIKRAYMSSQFHTILIVIFDSTLKILNCHSSWTNKVALLTEINIYNTQH